MADGAVTRTQMEAAGLAEIALERIDVKVNVGPDIENTVCFQLALGPAGGTGREAGARGKARHAEIAIAALARSLTGAIAAVAQHRGIQFDAVEAKVEGDVDVQVSPGMDPEIRYGLSSIRVSFEIDAVASRDGTEALVAQSERTAVFDILIDQTSVAVADA